MTYRYEKKFIVDIDQLHSFRYWLKANGYAFQPSFPPRYVHNLYFDSPLFINYFDNLSGCSSRLKCRLRWYMETANSMQRKNYAVKDLYFEAKVRQNMIGYKLLQKLSYNELPLLPLGSLYRRLRCFLKPEFKIILDRTTHPVLYNHYLREYYSAEKDIRLTIDTEIKYANLQKQNSTLMPIERLYEGGIVEIKYPQHHENDVADITNSFPFRAEKNSKYVKGISSALSFLNEL